ncbi:4'-phosphopantetheinyl transferase [Symbiobacterium terraclitae]|uniref:4'-phosphopantetheinyl transferase n=1 Tax=Symbiobacterium terraclitae TaxID=557451 RepID=A0ABS4JVF0_9FIRM|nr:4'-phosphopantetheinyl transferase [Symbiobacterium terraclitae]
MAERAWAPPEEWPDLGAHEVHVWRLPLDLDAGRLGALWPLLSREEQLRARGSRTALLGSRFVAARGQLRQLLGRYLRQPPQAVRFRYGERGKPGIAHEEGIPLQFSLSHAGRWALVAASRGIRVGVDLEVVRPRRDLRRAADLVLSPAEAAGFARLPPEEQLQAFYRVWVRKEALVKGLGCGLAMPVRRLELCADGGLARVRLRRAPDPAWAAGWAVHDLPPIPGYAGALAAESLTLSLRTWQFSSGKVLRAGSDTAGRCRGGRRRI